MDIYAKLIATLRGVMPAAPLPVITGKVKFVDGESCTVSVGGVDLDEVRLKATINGSGNKILITPKIDSYVLLGSLTGDLKDLCVLKIDEVEQLSYEQDGLKVMIDSTTKKISIANDQVNLKNIFQELSDLLKQFKVLTSSGPSVGLVPDTLTAIKKFETDFKQLLN